MTIRIGILSMLLLVLTTTRAVAWCADSKIYDVSGDSVFRVETIILYPPSGRQNGSIYSVLATDLRTTQDWQAGDDVSICSTGLVLKTNNRSIYHMINHGRSGHSVAKVQLDQEAEGIAPASRHTSAARSSKLNDSDAQFIDRVTPTYPEEVRSEGIQGTTIVEVTINPAGKLLDATIYQSSGNQFLDKAALEAARLSTYRGPAITTKYLVEYKFRLQQ